MEHPLVTVDKSLNIEQLGDKINELNRKLTWAMRTGNGDMMNQIRMAIESYTLRLNALYKEKDKNNDNEKYTKNIDIS